MTPLLVAPILLSLTLLVSGVAKIPDRTATADAMVSLRLPARGLHTTVALALPIVEIVLAVALWMPVAAVQTAAAILALALTLVYLVIIGRALRFEETVDCSCFGTWGSPTVSGGTLGRNIILVLLAGVTLALAATGGIATAVTVAPLVTAALAIAVAVAVVLTALTIGVSRRGDEAEHAAMSMSPAGAAPASGPGHSDLDQDDSGEDDAEELDYLRSETPFGMLREAGKEPITLRTLTQQRAALLVWVNPGCGPCERVMSAVPQWQEELGGIVALRTLFRRDPEGLSASVLDRVGDTAALDIDRNLAQAFEAHHAPSAVLLGADGMLAGGPVRGSSDVFEFVQEIVEQLREAGMQGEDPAPAGENALAAPKGPSASSD